MLRQRMEELQSSLASAGEGVAAELAALKQQAAELTAANRVLDEENDRIEGEKMEVESALEAAQAEAAARSAAVDAAEAREKEATETAEALGAEKEKLQSDMDHLQAQVEQLQAASAEVCPHSMYMSDMLCALHRTFQ